MDNPTSCHVIVRDKKGDILLTRRRDVPLWVIPGGHCLPGENPKITAQRECLEETGNIIKITDLIAVYKTKNTRKNLYAGVLIKKIDKPDLNEVSKLGWFDVTRLPSPMTLFERDKISDFLNFQGKVVEKFSQLNPKVELLNIMKNPINFFVILIALLKNQFGKKSFKLKLD